MGTWDDFVFEVKVALGIIGVCVVYNWLTTDEEEEWEEDLGWPGVGWGVIPRDTGTGSEHWWGEHHGEPEWEEWGEQEWEESEAAVEQYVLPSELT